MFEVNETHFVLDEDSIDGTENRDKELERHRNELGREQKVLMMVKSLLAGMYIPANRRHKDGGSIEIGNKR
jgi:hypothetical protein